MPLWLVYHPPEIFADDESKRALAKDITGFYTLPSFYVVVNFIKVPASDVFVAGEPRTGKTPFVRITVDHIAVRQPNEEAAYKRVRERLNAVLKPHIADKGWEYEFHVDETERRLWMIQGYSPPPFRSEAEKLWAKEGKPVPYEHLLEPEAKGLDTMSKTAVRLSPHL